MTPTHDHDTPANGSPEPCPAHAANVPSQIARLRHTPRPHPLRRTLRRRRPVQPSTVWPCAQDDLHAGTGLLADWLLTAVIKIVTHYTQPGHRVLLLDPAVHLTPRASQPTCGGRSRSRPGPYAGLHEASWTVVRLGRGVHTRTAVARPERVGDGPGDESAESESGFRPNFSSPITVSVGTQPARPQPGPDSTLAAGSPDRYDLIITAAEPHTLDWFHPADWADLLTPTGTLAAITHGDRFQGRFVDPIGALVRAAKRAGLRYLDHIALLRAPIRDDKLDGASPVTHSLPQTHIKVHDDLLVFARRSAPAIAGDRAEKAHA